MVTELFIKSPVPGIDGVGWGEVNKRREIETERRWRERGGGHRVVMSPGSSINRQMR